MPDYKARMRALQKRIPQAMQPRRDFFRHRLAALKREAATGLAAEILQRRIASLEGRLQRSIGTRTWRRRHLPQPALETSLPISACRDEIIAAIREHPVVIVCGETGSGKTTQLPKFCLAAGRGIDGQIACTQPRRIAAIRVARRIAEEMGEPLGQSVGYKIRFQDQSRPTAFIKIMTDGMLLAETRSDPLLSRYDTLIIDEAHERSLNIDFALGIIRRLQKRRRDLKLIITSATIDTEKFSRAFDAAPVIEVSGRTYPVDIRYRPAEDGAGETNYVENAAAAVREILHTSRFGDVLVFMPCEQDIRDACELMRGWQDQTLVILPLFARLTAGEQAGVFVPRRRRKVIVATNVAETSITIPGIRYVVDTGLARISRYRPRTRTTSLRIRPISRSSADQRAGRCGRVADGVCVRLFSEEDYLARPLYTTPEILRTNLAEVILRMMALKLGDIADFPFIDAPARQNVADGLKLLVELGAVTETEKRRKSAAGGRHALTPTGRRMADLPIDPRLARILIAAHENDCLEQMAVIAAALSIQDPRMRPAEKSAEADRVQQRFRHPRSDFITWLNLWQAYHHSQRGEHRRHLSKSQSRKRAQTFCREYFLSFRRMREWCDIHEQICNILRDFRFLPPADNGRKDADIAPPAEAAEGFPPGYCRLHQAILTGFLSQIARQEEGRRYRSARGAQIWIFPGSALFAAPGPWIVSAETVETSRVYARTCAQIDPAWLEELAPSLCRYSYSRPHWDETRGQVVATEKVSLFGLPIVTGRKVAYARVNPAEACDIFIREGLVAGRLSRPPAFLKQNREQIAAVRKIEDRLRRRDLFIGEQQLFAFYRRHLDGCTNLPAVQKKIRAAGSDDFLRLSAEDLQQYRPDDRRLALYPDQVPLGNSAFPCRYRFKPGAADDGLTVQVPAGAIDSLDPAAADWLVPGMLGEKIAALIRALPKPYRKKLVPVSRTADIICREIQPRQRPLVSALAEFIHRRFGVDIPGSAWQAVELPDHLQMRFCITDPRGREIHAGRGSAVLDTGLGNDESSAALKAARARWEKTGLTSWNFGDLPAALNVRADDGSPWRLYPALEKDPADDGSVRLRLLSDRHRALTAHRRAVAVLAAGELKRPIRFLKKTLKLPPEVAAAAVHFGGAQKLQQGLRETVLAQLLEKDIRGQKDFEDLLEKAATEMPAAARRLLEAVCPVVTACGRVHRTLDGLAAENRGTPAAVQIRAALRSQVDRLVPQHFYRLYDAARLPHLERYLAAIEIRARRAVIDPAKERQRAGQAAFFENALKALVDDLATPLSEEKKTALEDFFWYVEEFKVSLFAQELKTAVPVSEKRLRKRLADLERMP